MPYICLLEGRGGEGRETTSSWYGGLPYRPFTINVNHVSWLCSVETLVRLQSLNSIQTPYANPDDGFKNTQHFCTCYLDHPNVLATNPPSDFKETNR